MSNNKKNSVIGKKFMDYYLANMKVETLKGVYNNFLDRVLESGLNTESFSVVTDTFFINLSEDITLKEVVKKTRRVYKKLTKPQKEDMFKFVINMNSFLHLKACEKSGSVVDFSNMKVILNILGIFTIEEDVKIGNTKFYGIDRQLAVNLVEESEEFKDLLNNVGLSSGIPIEDMNSAFGNKLQKSLVGSSEFVSKLYRTLSADLDYILRYYYTVKYTRHELHIENYVYLRELCLHMLRKLYSCTDDEYYVFSDEMYDILYTRKYLLPKSGVLLKDITYIDFVSSVKIKDYIDDSGDFIIDVCYNENKCGFIINMTQRFSTVSSIGDFEVVSLILKFMKCTVPEKLQYGISLTVKQDNGVSYIKGLGVDTNKLKKINFKVFIPEYWGIKSSDKAVGCEKGESSFEYIDKIESISAYVRKLPIGQEPSKEVKSKAKKYCLELKEGYTIVEPFNRVRKVKLKEY